jgi:hypothetical protein
MSWDNPEDLFLAGRSKSSVEDSLSVRERYKKGTFFWKRVECSVGLGNDGADTLEKT